MTINETNIYSITFKNERVVEVNTIDETMQKKHPEFNVLNYDYEIKLEDGRTYLVNVNELTIKRTTEPISVT